MFSLNLKRKKIKIKLFSYLLFPFYIFFIFHIGLSILRFFLKLNDNIYLKLIQKLYFIEEYFSCSFTLIVIYIIYKKIKAYENINTFYDSKKVIIETKWLKHILLFGILICIIWVSMILYNNINSLPLFSNINRYFLWISNSILIYYLGYLGIYYNGIFKQRSEIRKTNRALNKELIPKNKKRIEKIKNDIFKDKIFLNSNLTLYLIAEKYNLNESYLSQVFNKNSDTNFPSYINKLRIEEAKRLLVDETFKNYDIVSIALESGFNSKYVFYTAFKKETGLTPTQYRKQNLS